MSKNKRLMVYFKVKAKIGDYFFNIYEQFIIKNIHSSSGNFIVIALSFSSIIIVTYTRNDN